jgi:hypothetical protein
VTAAALIRLQGWGIVPQSPACTVLTVLDPDTDQYVSAPVDVALLDGDDRAAEHIYAKLERRLRPDPLARAACQHADRLDISTYGDGGEGLIRYVCPGCGEQWTERRPA